MNKIGNPAAASLPFLSSSVVFYSRVFVLSGQRPVTFQQPSSVIRRRRGGRRGEEGGRRGEEGGEDCGNGWT